MKAQSVGDASSLEFMRGRRVLEINPEHPIIRKLNVRWNKNPATLHIYDIHSYTHLLTSNVTFSNIVTLVCRLHMGVTQMMMML
jgi:heat shock protein beta